MDIFTGFGESALRFVPRADALRARDEGLPGASAHQVTVRGLADARQLVGWRFDEVQMARIRSFIAAQEGGWSLPRCSDAEVIAHFAQMVASGAVCVMRAGPRPAPAGDFPGGAVGMTGTSASPAATSMRPPRRRPPPASTAPRWTPAPASHAARTPAPRAPLGPRSRHALLFVVIDEEGDPLPGMTVALVGPGGASRHDTTGVDGSLLFDDLDLLRYTLHLDQLDAGAWEVIHTAPLNDAMRARATVCGADWGRDRPAPPNIAADQEVGATGCVATIAYHAGFHLATIWDHPCNRELKSLRANPYVLAPKDNVHVPARTLGSHPCSVDTAVVIRRRGIPERVRVQFLRSDFQVRANQPYQLHIRYHSGALVSKTGTTDSQGFLDEPVFPEIVEAWVDLPGVALPEVLDITALNPLAAISGWKQRLNNLGYGCDSSDDVDRATRLALRHFQRDRGLLITGSFDQATRTQLVKTCHS